jgi:hypothetical protein
LSSDLRKWIQSTRASHVFGAFDKEQPTSIYRYLPLVQLISLLETRSLALLDPQSWPDKAEAGWIDKIFGANAPLGGATVRAACFTRESYSEALWHVYARMPPVVRVRVTLLELVGACAAFSNPSGKFYFGDVRYQDSGEMRTAFQEVSRKSKPTSRDAASLLLLKRRAFAYEREVRVLWLTQKKIDEVVNLPLDPKMITQVLVSPYAPDWVLSAIDTMVSKRYKLKCEIARSTLDRAPSWMTHA